MNTLIILLKLRLMHACQSKVWKIKTFLVQDYFNSNKQNLI